MIHSSTAEYYASTAINGISYVFLGLLFYITVSHFGKAILSFREDKVVGEILPVPAGVFHIKETFYSCLLDWNNFDS